MADQCCKTLTTAFVISLIGSIIIILSGLIILAGGRELFLYGALGSYYYPWLLGGFPWTTGFTAFEIGTTGIVCGALILLGALMLKIKPASHVTWGVAILVGSAISPLEGGGFIIGAILGIIGGILAISWKPENLP